MSGNVIQVVVQPGHPGSSAPSMLERLEPFECGFLAVEKFSSATPLEGLAEYVPTLLKAKPSFP